MGLFDVSADIWWAVGGSLGVGLLLAAITFFEERGLRADKAREAARHAAE